MATPPTPHTTAAAMLNSCYEAAIAASNTSMPPLRRKKLSSFLMSRDTPILRTVLGQGQADSSQPMSLVCHSDGQDQEPQSNGPTTPQDLSYMKVRVFHLWLLLLFVVAFIIIMTRCNTLLWCNFVLRRPVPRARHVQNQFNECNDIISSVHEGFFFFFFNLNVRVKIKTDTHVQKF